MCNLVEWGLDIAERYQRIRYLAEVVLKAAEISDFSFENEDSEIYGNTIDVIHNGIELASSAMGPHPLDAAFGVDETWVGLGFGLERLLMAREGTVNIHRFGKSLSYLDGIRLNIK
jgi:phenylalanyl-tRNA synthetase alpha chain